jgi:hypothetical protein
VVGGGVPNERGGVPNERGPEPGEQTTDPPGEANYAALPTTDVAARLDASLKVVKANLYAVCDALGIPTPAHRSSEE